MNFSLNKCPKKDPMRMTSFLKGIFTSFGPQFFPFIFLAFLRMQEEREMLIRKNYSSDNWTVETVWKKILDIIVMYHSFSLESFIIHFCSRIYVWDGFRVNGNAIYFVNCGRKEFRGFCLVWQAGMKVETSNYVSNCDFFFLLHYIWKLAKILCKIAKFC